GGIPHKEEEVILGHAQLPAQEAPPIQIQIAPDVQGDSDLPQIEVADGVITEDLPPPPKLKMQEPLISILDVGTIESPPLPCPTIHLCQEENQERIGDDKAWKMMAKIGHRKGQGLGRNEQGMKKFTHKMANGQRGIGYTYKGEPYQPLNWDMHD